MADEAFSKGNEAFVAENYEESVKLYTQAIEEDETKGEYYSNRAHACIKLGKYEDALSDAVKGIELNNKNAKAYLRKGVALFHLDRVKEAKEALENGIQCDSSDKSLQEWLEICDKKILESGGAESKPVTKTEPVQSVPMPTGPKTRYDWYQTETHVIVTILIKNVKKDDFTIDIQEKSISANIKLPTGSDYVLDLDLAHPIVPEKSISKIMTSKIEVKLKKSEGIRWSHLEGEEETKVKQFNPAASKPASDTIHKYPSSAHTYHDWDKLAFELTQEEKDEKLEGDAALNKLFQQIYGDGSDEVKRAMNKSFVESGGTVLSTNWKEIGSKKTEVKPPDGMEHKKYEY